MSLVRLNNVTVRFGDRPVLREAHFRLQKGDRVGLIGRNGAGKTTLLKLVLAEAGMGGDEPLHPDEGQVDVAPGVRVGYFSQFSELDDDHSVQQVVELRRATRELPGGTGSLVEILVDHEFLAGRLDDAASYAVSTIEAPVFDGDGRVVLALALVGLPRAMTGAEIGEVAERLLTATRGLSAGLR